MNKKQGDGGMNKIKLTKQEAERLLANVPEEQAFWSNDGQVFRNLEDLNMGLNEMSDETYAYHSNAEKHDFSNWLRDVVQDEKLASDLAKPIDRQGAASRVSDRIALLEYKLT
jgi:hypothetical protein